MNIKISDNCNIANIIWIDRGILLTIINYVNKLYNKLLNKIIIIDNNNYRKALEILFPKMKFSKYISDNEDNFYFNIRNIIQQKDIIIDYLHNYKKNIPSKKFKYIPWYDYNDPLIVYKFSNKHKISKKYNYIDTCLRSNYKGYLWDFYEENKIILNVNERFKKYSYNYILHIINEHLNSKYRNTTIYKHYIYPFIYNTNIKKNSKECQKCKECKECKECKDSKQCEKCKECKECKKINEEWIPLFIKTIEDTNKKIIDKF